MVAIDVTLFHDLTIFLHSQKKNLNLPLEFKAPFLENSRFYRRMKENKQIKFGILELFEAQFHK